MLTQAKYQWHSTNTCSEINMQGVSMPHQWIRSKKAGSFAPAGLVPKALGEASSAESQSEAAFLDSIGQSYICF